MYHSFINSSATHNHVLSRISRKEESEWGRRTAINFIWFWCCNYLFISNLFLEKINVVHKVNHTKVRRDSKWIKSWKCNTHLPFLKSSSYSIDPLALSCLEALPGISSRRAVLGWCHGSWKQHLVESVTHWVHQHIWGFCRDKESWWLFTGHSFALAKSRPAFIAHGWEQEGKHQCLGSAELLLTTPVIPFLTWTCPLFWAAVGLCAHVTAPGEWDFQNKCFPL